MESSLLGVPLVIWGIVCLGLAIVWVIVWPRTKATPTDGIRYVILRWFHALTWLLLGLAAFAAAFNIGGPATVRGLALLALLAYLVFVGTSVFRR